MSLFKTITQGGQVNIHQLHMLKQVLMAGGMVAVIGGGGYFVWRSFTLPSSDWRQAYEHYWARFMLATVPADKEQGLKQLYQPPRGRSYERSVISVLRDPLIQRTTRKVEKFAERTAYQSLGVGGGALLSILGLWFLIGLGQKRAKHERGNRLVSWRILASILKRRREASDLKLGPLPLLKGKETSHILMTGTTNAFHILLPQIKKRRNRAIIVDVTGDYVSRYYNDKTDLLLNPLDIRSQIWNPWSDCQLDSHYDVLADSLIQPKDGNRDPFWDIAARALLKTALRKCAAHGRFDIEELSTFLISASGKTFEDFFEGTESATYASLKNKKATYSIRSVLSSQIEGFQQLDAIRVETQSCKPQERAFSIRDWVTDEKQQGMPLGERPGGWLFITARADQRKTLIPLISAWIDIALNALMVLSESQERRLWFVMDELAALQKLPSLQMGLAEVRKYGGCILVGFQSKPQLEELYGRNSAEAMLDLFNTKIFFRCTQPSTEEWISKVLGDKEEAEPTENISFGANSMRDGVSLGRHTRQKPLVLPSELSLLKDRECYLKYPGDLPCTKLQTKLQRRSLLNEKPFLLKPEKRRVYPLQSVPQIEERQIGEIQKEEESTCP